jgi:hypothetical protein
VPVVEALVVGKQRRGLGDAASRADDGQSAPEAAHPSAAGGGERTAQLVSEVEGLLQADATVVDRSREQRTQLDVDPRHRLRRGIPHDSLGQQSASEGSPARVLVVDLLVLHTGLLAIAVTASSHSNVTIA